MDRSHPILRIGPDGVGLRKHPYPYRAAFTVDNDIDGMDAGLFRKLYEFFTTTRDTDLGPGLGLPLSSSFFCSNFGPSKSLSLFKPGGFEPGPDADLIVECNHKGLLDTLHTYGCYSKSGAFTRGHAERCLAALEKQGIKMKCWSHHGDEHNIQNLKPQNAGEYHGQGDDPQSSAYHLDLLEAHGMRYFWLSLGGHSSFIGCDNNPAWLADNIALNLLRQAGERPGFNIDIRPVINPLFRPQRMRDGRTIWTYQRFNGGLSAGIYANTLPVQVDEAVLNWLIQSEGVMVLYQHLGFGGTPAWGPDYLDGATLAALRAVARHYHQGRLYVDTLSNVLNFGFVQRHLKWTLAREGDLAVVELDPALDDGGPARKLEAADLAGQCFMVDLAGRVRINFQGREIAGVRKTDSDDYGLSYWMIPRPTPVSL